MAHKKQYFRVRCHASFAIMRQGVTPTHIVPFGHFGFTAKYKRTPYQNDTDKFSLGYPMTKSVVSVIACQTCLSYETDKPTYLYSLVALVGRASVYLVTGAFRPIDCMHFACVTLHACSAFVGRDGIEPPQARQCVRIPYGITCLLALVSEIATTCEESTLSRVCTHPHRCAYRYYQARDCRRGSSLPFGYGCRHCPRNP